MNKKSAKWKFWIDRGGTFTDVLAMDPYGTIHAKKVLSDNPHIYKDPIIEGIKQILKLKNKDNIPSHLIEELRIGTTVATNALLTRTGSKTALFITKGFKDALKIGNQSRPDIFARNIKLPKPINEKTFEIFERLSKDGKVIDKLDVKRAKNSMKKAINEGYNSAAIVLLHGWKHKKHEKILEKLAMSLNFENISISYKVAPLIGLIGRGDTTVADAYLTPVLKKYARDISKKLKDTKIFFMQSSGGLSPANNFKGKDAVLSGPAGGVIAAVEMNKKFNQFTGLIGLDMGGTSTDVFHYEKEYERSTENIVAGTRIRSPMLTVNTIASGGGSIIKFDGQKISVGPNSAGANPGPACYGLNGPLTITDCNFILGKLNSSYFPKIFGPNADKELNLLASKTAAKNLCNSIKSETGKSINSTLLAKGALDIAIENMANAIRHISIQKGHDISNHALVAYGAAAGQVACDIADALDIKSIIFNSQSGLLSAYGLGHAKLKSIKNETIDVEITKGFKILIKKYGLLKKIATSEFKSRLDNEKKISITKKILLKYEDTDVTIPIKYMSIEKCINKFEVLHKKRFGFIHKNKKIIIDQIEIEIETEDKIKANNGACNFNKKNIKAKSLGLEKIYFHRKYNISKSFNMKNLNDGEYIIGPAIIYDSNSTIIIPPLWKATVVDDKKLLLNKTRENKNKIKVGTKVDPLRLEIFNNMFMSVAEEMGVVLQKTSHSVNIKERLDFSCALFDKSGSLIANAPHIPIHLGAMSETIKAVIKKNKDNMNTGDSFIHNSPYDGGTHLPDITIISPVFIKDQKFPKFYVASRAHHSDIGGSSPGSMPADSKHIDQEGTVFYGEKIVSKGIFMEKKIKNIFLKGNYPARNVESNIADLKAQLAASSSGKNSLSRIINKYGIKTVESYMQHVQDNAEESIRKVINKLNSGSFKSKMDNGALINIKISVDKNTRNAIFNFSGTSPQRLDNFNAPKAVTRSAVLYVLRTLVKDKIPLNDGCLIPVKILIPEGSMLNPSYPAPVVAGNVETSQSIVDTINGALEVQAACYGTMSNFTFGNKNFGYYETICGGEGASDYHHGSDAVQCHMTNTRLTDPEVFESRYPVRLVAFFIRKNSGGDGKFHGGNGTVREIKFLNNMTAVILSNRRKTTPFGICGGKAGLVGKNILKQRGKKYKILNSCDSIKVGKGDIIIIKTPGGGGYGKKINY
ncbi:MAG: Acetophenone carboxylase gamma subunit [Alphaproteobacteria bacterium MarineAlpha9_Bin1]|nr:MAG: Acetophenone carboxylase gamma subunit [Alphaproteobacteria bacterium MarineAlpha9_Bin1]